MRWIPIIALIACASVEADVVTRRIGTGLPPSGPPSLLPESWVAPVKAPPAIDGRLDDDAWSRAVPIVLGSLLERRSILPRTEVRLLRDGANLYAAFRLEEPQIGAIRRQATQADGPAWEDDSVEIFLSPRPGAGYYQIVIGAGGAIFDRTDHNDPAAWNSAARAAVGFGDEEWSVEIAIPFASLGVRGDPPARLRANVYRNRRAGPEGASQAWSPTLRPDYDVPERFGALLFTSDPPPDPFEARPEGKPGIEIMRSRLSDGTLWTLLYFDLSFLPIARIHRARLLCARSSPPSADPDALAPIEVKWPGGMRSGRPLPLVPPDFRSFDITALVRESVVYLQFGQAPTRGLRLELTSFPGWRPEETYLEVMYDGTGGERPRQVSGLEVFHRAGQTFITWQEVDPPIAKAEATWGEIKAALARARDGIRYRIYAHYEPIDGRSIAQARLIAEVEPLSGFNVNARNVEYLIGQAMIEPEEMGELARDYGGFPYTWHMDHSRMDRYPVPRFVIDEKKGPLPAGMGLYVHNPTTGRRYYAVVSCEKGIENLIDFSAANSLANPVDETVGAGEPVLQGPGLWGPYFDYPGRRNVYVQWCAPPLSPLPGMAYNWSVLVPPDLAAGSKAPLELTLHGKNGSYAKPRKKYLRGSIQIAPHDWPPSGWYGFHDAYGTLRPWKEGAVRNQTQRRIFSFLDWAERRFPIDAERIILTGSDGGACLALAARGRFAYVLIGGFEGSGKLVGRVLDPDEVNRYSEVWGPKSPLIRDQHGRTEWGWAMLDALAAERPGESAPLFVCAGASWGGVRQYAKAFGPFYTRMQEVGQSLIAGYGWDTKLVPPDEWTGLWGPRLHLAMEPLDIARTTPIPAFANSSRSQETEQWGSINYLHAWKDLRDEPDAFRITLVGEGKVDMTPRRLQRFTPKRGEVLRWQAGERSGTVTADAYGLVTLKELEIPAGGLVVTILRAQGKESR